jgi:O-antigen/teichoic acid export membrane protein
MKKLAKKAIKNKFISGSFIVITGNLVANFFNFLFNVFMSRSLSVIDYGTLASIITLITFPALLTSAVNPVVVRYAGSYFAKGELSLVRGLYLKFTQFFLLFGVICFTIFIVILSQISAFFHIDNLFILFFANGIMFITLINITNISFIQAKLAFRFNIVIGLSTAVAKLLFGILFIYVGYSVTGAVGAIFISAIVTLVLGFYPFRFILSKNLKSSKIGIKELFRYGIPAALTQIGLTSFISLDILFGKHFFTSEQAGLYAGLSLIGKVIFYVTGPICGVMFPIIVQKYSNNERTQNTLLLSIIFTLSPALVLTGFYFLFPEYTILFFLKKTEYLKIIPYVGFFGLSITLYSIHNLLATFYLAINKTRVYIPILCASVLQIIFFIMYHQTIQQMITVSLSINLLLVIGFLLYYPYATKK